MRTIAAVIALMLCATASGASEDQRFEACQAKLRAAQKLDLLYALDWKPPKEPYVVAGPTFGKIAIDAKEGFAETVNCFLVGGTDRYVSFDILDWKTGVAIGRWRNGRLRMN